jgi:predicted lipoprotein with Yx(FWY)xxD motif
MMKTKIAFGVAALAMLAVPSLTWAQDYGDAKLAMTAKEPFGEYVTDSAGRSLYMFEEDERGRSDCYEKCAEVWPPMIAKGETIGIEDVDKDLVGLIERKDGLMQITYNGMPLYYYVKDKGRPGSTTGHDVHDEFGEWYLVTTSGKKVAAPAAQPESETKALGAEQGTEQQQDQGTQDY